MNKSFQDIVLENGFSFEEYPVITKDGYKLKVFRISSSSTPKNAPIVFMQHGIMDTANCWIMNRADVAPAFQLVRAGYDVWLGNQRGTTYSIGHTTLDTRGKAYWEFSFTEMGEYDAPAQMEFALNHTGQKKIAAYIGHSQGTSQMFYALSAHPDYWKEKLGLFVALAPVTSLKNTPNELMKVAQNFKSEIQLATNLLHLYVILQEGLASFITSEFCSYVPTVCAALQIFVTSTDPTLDDKDRFQVYMGHFPSGASIQSMMHYAQLITKDDMELYDWGSQNLNYVHYGQYTPPKVDFSKITVPTAMFVGFNDELGDPKDNLRTKSLMNPNTLVHYEMILGGHTTFIVGKDMSYFDTVKSLIKSHLG